MTLEQMGNWLAEDLPSHFTAQNKQDLYAVASTGLVAARGVAPVLTGKLRSSIVLTRGGTDAVPSVTIGSPLDYAAIQENRRGYIADGFDTMIDELKQRGHR